MSVRKQSVEELVADFEASPLFRKVYKNTVPVWTKVNTVPAVSVLYSKDFADRETLTSNKIKYNGTILIYVYNKQGSTKYDDILTDLIEEAQRIVIENEYLRCNTIECIVEETIRDGGTVHPWAMAQIKVYIKYTHRI
jgi:hypothetical protein